jgi:hypothetical protein
MLSKQILPVGFGPKLNHKINTWSHFCISVSCCAERADQHRATVDAAVDGHVVFSNGSLDSNDRSSPGPSDGPSLKWVSIQLEMAQIKP